VPTSAALGVPINAPLEALKLSHAGFSMTENVSGSPSGSVADALNT
jgi:hypothetical protein